jgi:hypothetical protein
LECCCREVTGGAADEHVELPELFVYCRQGRFGGCGVTNICGCADRLAAESTQLL